MKISELLEQASDTITVKRVYGEPYGSNGLTIIPAAAVSGGGGGGSGGNPGEQGEGGGFGANARPIGAYVIKDGEVTWRPAFDVNRVVTMAGLALFAYLLRRPRREAEDSTSEG